MTAKGFIARLRPGFFLYTVVTMQWVKIFHIFSVISWFAGIFYLPRIYVNLAMLAPEAQAERERLIMMSRKLLKFMWFPAVPSVVLGFWYWFEVWGFGPGTAWLHAKTFFVFLIVLYHYACARILKQFEAGTNRRSHVWFRWFNEIPVPLLLIVVALVVLKPF